jgi:hypothetical protein
VEWKAEHEIVELEIQTTCQDSHDNSPMRAPNESESEDGCEDRQGDEHTSEMSCSYCCRPAICTAVCGQSLSLPDNLRESVVRLSSLWSLNQAYSSDVLVIYHFHLLDKMEAKSFGIIGHR